MATEAIKPAERKPFIGGKFVDGEGAVRVRNPWDGSIVSEVELASLQNIELALSLAEKAHIELASLKPYERANLLQRISGLIEANLEKFAELITMEVGKPITLARIEVQRAVNTFKIACDEARRLEGQVFFQEAYAKTGGRYAILRRFPLSTMLAITPFNFPLNLVAHKVAPALAVGTSVIHKPSRYCPLTALLLAKVVSESGVPPGAYSVIPCAPESLDFLIETERIRKISFTGSAQVGWDLKNRCGKKKITLELGGNAAVVIEEVDDIKGVAERVAKAAFAYAGQICISVQRVLVKQNLYHNFLNALVEFTENGIKSGDPKDEAVLNGPMISEADVVRIHEWVTEAVNQGAKVLTGGKREGFVYLPTILVDFPRDAKVWNEEAFAPVCCVYPYKSFEEAVRLVNESRFGLQAGYFLKDMDKALYAYDHTEVGAVLINDVPMARIDELPYGGVKDSGFGREGIRSAMEEMTEPRLLVLKPSR